MKKGDRRIHLMHPMMDVCTRCGLSAYDAEGVNCLTDGELAERAQWRIEAEKAAEAFRQQTKVR